VALLPLLLATSCRARPEPEALFARAEALRLRYEREASRRAIAMYGEAQAAWTRRGAAAAAARAAQRVGQTCEQLGALHDSLKAHAAALALAERSGDRLLESGMRIEVGLAQALAADRADELEEARRQCERGLAAAEAAGGGREQARGLDCLGEVQYHRGDLAGALELYRRAEPVWRKLGDARGQAQSLLYQGYVLSDLGRLDDARARYEKAASFWASLGDRRGQAVTLVAQARLHQRRGENQQALNRFDEALRLLEPMGDAVWQGASLTGEAMVYEDMGEPRAATESWRAALRLFEEAGLANYSIDIVVSLGDTALASGDDVAALQEYQRALALSERLGNPRWHASALRHVGLVHLVRGHPRRALQYAERALEEQIPLGDPKLEGRTRADIGEGRYRLGELGPARRQLEAALALARSTGDRVGESRALLGLARTEVGRGDLDSARGDVEAALRIVESLRTGVESRELRASYLASVYAHHELHVDVLMRLYRARGGQGLAAAALEASERARARSLLDSLAEAGVDLQQDVDPVLRERGRVLESAFEDWAARQRSGGAADEAGRRTLAREYRDLEERYEALEAEVRSRSPRYAALARPRPLRLREIQREVLDRDTVLLEYALGEGRSYLWAVSSHGLSSHELPPRAEIEAAARRAYDLLTARLRAAGGDPRDRRGRVEGADAEYWTEAARLSEMLLGPVRREMAGKRLLVVADGTLQYLPFGALPVPGGRGEAVPMAVEHEIVSLPSASVLAVLRREARVRTTPAKVVAVLADPVFEADDPRLRRVAARVRPAAGYPRLAATRQEADAIVGLAPKGTALRAVGFDASRATAMGPALAQYRIVHLATHGLFDNENPGLSGVVLSLYDERGEPRDGVLRLRDVYRLRLAADLVVLSACSTALGRPVRGEGLVGIVRGFMYAGARRVVAGLWKVEDDATSEMMGRFYREMLERGRSPAAALREAQIQMWRQDRWRAPFYWAAFVLQGEWR
jgi:CHAT domain-containing protein/tetratricopeptide (TPR) repeat protein